MDVSANAMISIRPAHADSILAGIKTVELRRRFTPLPMGSRLWIYSTLPVGALVATAKVSAIDYDVPQVLWSRYQHNAAVSECLFFDYFGGCDVGCAIGLSKVEPITPVPLASIRKIRGVPHIPQVAIKLSSGEARKFERYSQRESM